jgi:type IV pilus assembly protein PilX
MHRLRNFTIRNSGGRERGAVLVIALILLLVVTVLGVTGMRSTLLEERMTGNTQDMNVAFQAAEAALREGEELLRQPELPAFDGSSGLYQPADAAGLPLWETLDWSSLLEVREYAGLAGAPGSLGRAGGRYFIEELPRVATPGESLAADAPVDDASFYRVTARGVGTAGAATVMLQSTYKR